jgi:hyperosmotically inducible protein
MRGLTAVGASIFFAAALIAGPGVPSAQTSSESMKDKTRSATDSAKTGMSDSWLTAKTKIALYADERVSGTQVNVDTKNGMVTLRGKVDSAEAKAAAESVAKGIDGVKSVKNELEVVMPSARKAVNANDKEIARAVETRLAQDPQLKKVEVRADAGVVTLTGEAPSVTASARASELARQVPGVRSVRNDLMFERKGEVGSAPRATESSRVTAGRAASSGAGSDEVRAMQDALKDRGFDPGPSDGVMGPRTAGALREYQKAENLRVTGQLDARTVSSLQKKRQSP